MPHSTANSLLAEDNTNCTTWTGIEVLSSNSSKCYKLECIPEAVKVAKRDMKENKLDSLQMHYVNVFGGFFIGCLGIGLILFDHEHCSADGGAHAH